MLIRICSLLTLQAVFGLLGWWWFAWPGAAAGVALAPLPGLVRETLRGRSLVRWLRAPDLAAPAVSRGLWGEASYHALRALRDARAATQESAQRLGDFVAAIQASPNGVILLDPQDRIEWCNDIAGRHFGVDPRRDLLQQIGNLIREPAFANYLAERGADRAVVLAGHADGSSHPVRLSVQLHSYGAGHRLMLSSDITALAQADAMRRDFVANVSHELRTPLTVLVGFVETMQSLPLSEAERDRYLSLMADQAVRMQALINDLLTLSRLEGSPLPDFTELVDLRALMVQCEAEARALSRMLHPSDDRPQRLTFAQLPGLALVGAPGEVRSAISNVVNNAVRYTPTGGAIDVRWHILPGGGARLDVTDTGTGIPPEHLSRLGERFYRVDRSRSRESGGTGLGLAITKHVVQRHGGELQISSALGQGSCFSLLFPAQRVRLPIDAAAAEQEPARS